MTIAGCFRDAVMWIRRKPSTAFAVVVFFVFFCKFYSNLPWFGKRQRPSQIARKLGKVGITVPFWGRLGNHMFQYASILGIAQKNRMVTFIPDDLELWTLFEVDSYVGGVESLKNFNSYEEISAAVYSRNITNLPHQDTIIYGYLQSFKYFDFMKSEILQHQFHFKEKYRNLAEVMLQRAITTHKSNVQSRNGYLVDIVVVGIHVRRGDFVRSQSQGYVPAPLPYFYRAMNYFHTRYPNVMFFVCSNEIIWCKKYLDDDNIFYSDSASDYVDLAALSLCNHTIISSGSYSWWAGYLSNGTVIYYKDFPRPGSSLDKSMARKDYYPQSWVPL